MPNNTFREEEDKRFDEEFKDSFSGGDMWNWERAEPIKTFLHDSHRRLVEKLVDSFDQLQKVKRSWEQAEKVGNPNEITKAQIFGFNQAYTLTQSTLNNFINQTLK